MHGSTPVVRVVAGLGQGRHQLAHVLFEDALVDVDQRGALQAGPRQHWHDHATNTVCARWCSCKAALRLLPSHSGAAALRYLVKLFGVFDGREHERGLEAREEGMLIRGGVTPDFSVNLFSLCVKEGKFR